MVIEEHVLVFEKGGFVHCWSSIAQVFKMSPHTLLPESDGGLYVLWRGGRQPWMACSNGQLHHTCNDSLGCVVFQGCFPEW